MQAHDCPNCGDQPRVETTFMGWFVLCDDCYDGGPAAWGMTERAAVDAWNEDCEDQKEFCEEHGQPSGRCGACDAEERADALYDEWKDGLG